MLNKVYEKMSFDDLDFINDLKVGPRDGHASFIYLYIYLFIYFSVCYILSLFTVELPLTLFSRVSGHSSVGEGWGGAEQREGRGVMWVHVKFIPVFLRETAIYRTGDKLDS